MGFASKLRFSLVLAMMAGEAFSAQTSLEALEEEEPLVMSAPSEMKNDEIKKKESENRMSKSGKTWFGMGYEQRMRMSRTPGARGRGGRGRR